VVLRSPYFVLPAQRAYERVHPLACGISQRACPGIREDAWWRNDRAAEDIDKIIPPVRLSAPLGRACCPRVFRASFWHISLASFCLCLYPSRSLAPFPPTRAGGLTYHEKSEKGVVRGQEDTRRRMRERDGGGG
jgi:hypothetical protein